MFQSLVSGVPYNHLILPKKNLLAAHVDYGAVLNANDFNTPILHDLGDLSANTTLEYKTNSNTLVSLQDDWTNRTTRKNHSQFMLFFPKAADDDLLSDIAFFQSGEDTINPPELVVTFLVP